MYFLFFSQDNSKWRHHYLNSLYEYMQGCNKELTFLAEEQDKIKKQDWSDRMVDPPDVRRQYEVRTDWAVKEWNLNNEMVLPVLVIQYTIYVLKLFYTGMRKCAVKNNVTLTWSQSELQEQQSAVPRGRGEQSPGWRRQTYGTEAPCQCHHTGTCHSHRSHTLPAQPPGAI